MDGYGSNGNEMDGRAYDRGMKPQRRVRWLRNSRVEKRMGRAVRKLRIRLRSSPQLRLAHGFRSRSLAKVGAKRFRRTPHRPTRLYRTLARGCRKLNAAEPRRTPLRCLQNLDRMT